MANLIQNTKSPVFTIVDAICFSSASLLLIAGKKRFMHKYSQLMIHQLSYGMAPPQKKIELDDQHKNSEKLTNMLKTFYLKNTGINKKELDELMMHDLYLDANECLKLKIIDKII